MEERRGAEDSWWQDSLESQVQVQASTESRLTAEIPYLSDPEVVSGEEPITARAKSSAHVTPVPSFPGPRMHVTLLYRCLRDELPVKRRVNEEVDGCRKDVMGSYLWSSSWYGLWQLRIL